MRTCSVCRFTKEMPIGNHLLSFPNVTLLIAVYRCDKHLMPALNNKIYIAKIGE